MEGSVASLEQSKPDSTGDDYLNDVITTSTSTPIPTPAPIPTTSADEHFGNRKSSVIVGVDPLSSRQARMEELKLLKSRGITRRKSAVLSPSDCLTDVSSFDEAQKCPMETGTTALKHHFESTFTPTSNEYLRSPLSSQQARMEELKLLKLQGITRKKSLNLSPSDNFSDVNSFYSSQKCLKEARKKQHLESMEYLHKYQNNDFASKWKSRSTTLTDQSLSPPITTSDSPERRDSPEPISDNEDYLPESPSPSSEDVVETDCLRKLSTVESVCSESNSMEDLNQDHDQSDEHQIDQTDQTDEHQNYVTDEHQTDQHQNDEYHNDVTDEYQTDQHQTHQTDEHQTDDHSSIAPVGKNNPCTTNSATQELPTEFKTEESIVKETIVTIEVIEDTVDWNKHEEVDSTLEEELKMMLTVSDANYDSPALNDFEVAEDIPEVELNMSVTNVSGINIASPAPIIINDKQEVSDVADVSLVETTPKRSLIQSPTKSKKKRGSTRSGRSHRGRQILAMDASERSSSVSPMCSPIPPKSRTLGSISRPSRKIRRSASKGVLNVISPSSSDRDTSVDSCGSDPVIIESKNRNISDLSSQSSCDSAASKELKKRPSSVRTESSIGSRSVRTLNSVGSRSTKTSNSTGLKSTRTLNSTATVPIYEAILKKGIRKNTKRNISDAAMCFQKWEPKAHGNLAGCERCLGFANRKELSAYHTNGHHHRIMMTRGGCCKSCKLFPRSSSQGGSRMCQRCFHDTHMMKLW